MADVLKTTCPYCGVGCGVLVSKEKQGEVKIKGDPDHPANFGKLCSKGVALGETLGLEERLLHPKIKGQRVDWETAIETVAQRFQKTIDEHGPDSVAFYVSGQLLSEDYYVANKLIKGFLGTANIDTNSRLCMSSSVAGHKRAFGSDTVPQTYEDIEEADLVVLTGSNLAWCHPILFQRLKAAKKKHGTKVVVIDPRKTATCEIADIHLAVKPGTDVKLFNGLLHCLSENGAINDDYVNRYVNNLDEAIKSAKKDASDVRAVAQTCDVAFAELVAFYDLFLQTEKTVTIYSQGVNQSSQGTDKVNAILNCHLMTGRIGKVGCGPLSVTGQPNAMGGREVGGLANMLASHMDFTDDDINRVKSFWNAPNIARKPGLKAVDMFDAVHSGQIKAIWIMATNPAVSMPDANKVQEALEKCEFVVVSEAIEKTGTTACADVLLPAATWGERNGTVTNSERCISRQRPFKTAPGEALADWEILTKVAHALGYAEQFPYRSSYDVFSEHVKLSAYENNGQRDFDLSGWLNLSLADFNVMPPTQWPVKKQSQQRFFSDGGFYTADKKAQMVAVFHQLPKNEPSTQYPYILNTGRIRDQWHTMTRTGLSAKLSGHINAPYLEIHPDTAKQEGLRERDLVKLSSRWGEAVLRVSIRETVKPGELFMPMHWTDENSSHAVVGRVVNPVVDPVSGQPESKHTPVSLSKMQFSWQGVLISRKKINTDGFAHWSMSVSKGCYVYDLAGMFEPADWGEYASVLLGQGDLLSFHDQKRKHHRFAALTDNVPTSVLITAQDIDRIPSPDFIASLFSQPEVTDEERLSLLSAKPSSQQKDKGKIICSCFSVGLTEIIDAIKEHNVISVDEVGVLLQAGTNCGSCQAEIKEIIGQFTYNKVDVA